MSIKRTVTFVSLLPNRASNTFYVYYDEEGTKHQLVQGVDKEGNDIPYRFKLGRDKRFVTIPTNKKDIYGNSYLDFLRNHPRNQNSPGASKTPWFKELDSDKDATIALDSYMLRNKAENLALSLKGKELEEVYKVLGFSGEPKVKFHKLMQYASKNCSDFIERVEDPNRKAQALLRAGVDNKIITKRGFVYKYQDIVLGNDEGRAVTKIAEDKDLQEILEKALGTAGA